MRRNKDGSYDERYKGARRENNRRDAESQSWAGRASNLLILLVVIPVLWFVLVEIVEVPGYMPDEYQLVTLNAINIAAAAIWLGLLIWTLYHFRLFFLMIPVLIFQVFVKPALVVGAILFVLLFGMHMCSQYVGDSTSEDPGPDEARAPVSAMAPATPE